MKTWHFFPFRSLFFIIFLSFFVTSCGENGLLSLNGGSVINMGKVAVGFTPTLIGGKDYKFTNTSVNNLGSESGIQYIWNFGDGSAPITKTDKSVFTYSFPSFSAKYVVSLTAKSSSGKNLGVAHVVTTGISSSSGVTVSASFAAFLVAGKDFRFTNTTTVTGISESGLQYIWNFGDGSGDMLKADKNISHSFPLFSTKYIVSLTVKDFTGNLIGFFSMEVTTGSEPKPDVKVTAKFSATPVIGSKDVTFINETILLGIVEGDVKYVWDFGDGSAEEAKTDKIAFTHLFPNYSTIYSVTLKVIENATGGILSSVTMDVTTGADPLLPSATASFTYIANGRDVTFMNTSTLTAITEAEVRYVWNFGDGSADETKTDKLDFVHTFPDFSTKYTAVLRVEKVADSSLLRTRSIEVTTGADPAVPPATDVNADFTYSLPDFYNKSMTFTNTSSPVSVGLQYIWEFGDTITETRTDITSFTHTYSASGLIMSSSQ